MEFNGKYAAYVKEFKEIGALLKEGNLHQETNISAALVRENQHEEIQPVIDAYNDIIITLATIADACHSLYALSEESKQNPSVLNRRKDCLEYCYAGLGQASTLSNKIENLKGVVDAIPNLKLKEGAKTTLLTAFDPETDMGLLVGEITRRAQMSHSMLSSIGYMEKTKKMTEIYRVDNPEMDVKSVVTLRKEYEESLQDYQKNIDAYNTDGHQYSVQYVDTILKEAKRDYQQAEDQRIEYHSEGYAEKQRIEHEQAKQRLEKNWQDKLDNLDEIKYDKEFISQMSYMKDLMPDVIAAHEKMGEESPDILEDELAKLNEVIGQVQSFLNKSKEWEEFEKAHGEKQDFAQKHRVSAETMDTLESGAEAAKEVLQDLDGFSRELDKNFLGNGIKFAHMKNMTPEKIFSFAFGASVHDRESVIARLKEVVPPKKGEVEYPTLKHVQAFITEMKRPGFQEKQNDFMLHGMITFVKMMSLEGMLEGPSVVREKEVNKSAENDKFDDTTLKTSLMALISYLVTNYQPVAKAKNTSPEYQRLTNIIIQKQTEVQKRQSEGLDWEAQQDELKEASMQLHKLAEDAEPYEETYKQSRSLLDNLVKQANFKPELLKDFCQTIGFADFGKTKKMSFTDYVYNQIESQNVEWFDRTIGQMDEEILEQRDILYSDATKSKAIQELQARYSKPIIGTLFDELGFNADGDTYVELCKKGIQSSIEMLRAEGEILGPKFQKYRELQAKESKAGEAYRKCEKSKELDKLQEQYNQIQKKLSAMKMQQQFVIKPLINRLRDVLSEGVQNRIKVKNPEEYENDLQNALNQLTSGKTVSLAFLKELESKLKELETAGKEKLEEREKSNLDFELNGIKYNREINETSPEAVEYRKEESIRKSDERKKDLDKAQQLYDSKEKAVELKRQLFDREKDLTKAYTEGGETVHENCLSQISREITALIGEKNKLPKRLIGKDSQAFLSMFSTLQAIQGMTDLAAVRDGLTNVKGAAEQYLEARSHDIKWFFWKKSGKSMSGEARLNLARDLIRFCDMNISVLQNVQPEDQKKIKDTVKEAREEQERVNSGYYVSYRRDNILQQDLDHREAVEKKKKQDAEMAIPWEERQKRDQLLAEQRQREMEERRAMEDQKMPWEIENERLIRMIDESHGWKRSNTEKQSNMQDH